MRNSSGSSRHTRIDVSPVTDESGLDWYEGYREHMVRHILEQSGLEVTQRHLNVCRNIPILAVFLSYLHTSGHYADLAELLGEADFAAWVIKRVQLSLRQDTIDRDLAFLMALFPMPALGVFQFDQGRYGDLLDTLAADRWIEKLSADDFYEVDTWITAHDVLADQILSLYFLRVPNTIDSFVHELLSLSSSIGCLRSAGIVPRPLCFVFALTEIRSVNQGFNLQKQFITLILSRRNNNGHFLLKH